MTDTATKILDVGQELIQTRGYSAMSFQHIAGRVGIKKPSIIHHFPSKATLGVAIIRRYRDTFTSQLDAIKKNPQTSAWEALDFYFSPYLHFAQTPDTVCLCGALAGEIPALPEEMRLEVKQFMEDHQSWLEGILQNGRRNGELTFSETPARLARMLFNTLQGTLLVKRSTDDLSQLNDVIKVIKRMLK
ncbi:MAG: TetR/AcrR family transcriptional repressor of nem operon [Glaciecola sp.]|jgi:TetR/AcrR family transcriptional repressor of nem operon|uniref:TetR/AcrR family transcriptional regulator n=1 Tax=Congregibacter sp. TaxID=2744308 RepID=UPI0039E2F7BA